MESKIVDNTYTEITPKELYQKLLDWNKKIDDEISLEKINKMKNKRWKKDGNLSPSDLKILISKFPTPINGIELIDIKLKNKYKEDDVYLEQNFIQKHIRRGESFLHNIISDEYDFARCGLPKFFDYKKKILEEKDKKNNNCVLGEIENIDVNNDKNKLKLKFYVYLTTKVNGENFQVSYNKKLKAWIIGSKNVSILCRNVDDLEFYKNENNFKENSNEKNDIKIYKNKIINKKSIDKTKNENINNSTIPLKEEDEDNNGKIYEIKNDKGDKNFTLFRYKFVLEFGKLWFDILDKKVGKEKIDNFINDIGDFTLIGENVGNKEHEHIMIYEEKDIIFYAIVNNNKFSTEKCLPFNESLEIFKKYGLSYVNINKSEKFNTYNQLINYLNEQYDIIFDKSMDEYGEGSVIYLATSEMIDDKEKEIIRGLGKLKTFEYRFLRKIREKCKHIPQRRNILDSNKELNEKEKEILQNKIRSENKRNKPKIDSIIESTINETEKLISDVEKSKYYLNSPDLLKWINFAKHVYNYWYMDSYDYNDMFASFIDKMKKLFYNSDKIPKIDENLINEVRKEVIKNK